MQSHSEISALSVNQRWSFTLIEMTHCLLKNPKPSGGNPLPPPPPPPPPPPRDSYGKGGPTPTRLTTRTWAKATRAVENAIAGDNTYTLIKAPSHTPARTLGQGTASIFTPECVTTIDTRPDKAGGTSISLNTVGEYAIHSTNTPWREIPRLESMT